MNSGNSSPEALEEQPAPQEYHTNMAVGEILRRAREHYGQSLEHVEANLRIRAMQLDALEKGDLEKLPGRVYAIGFVRSYSEYLGLDGDQMVRLFKAQSLGNRLKPALNFPVPASESRLPPAWLIIIGIIGFIGIFFLWQSYEDKTVVVADDVTPARTAEDVMQAGAISEPEAEQNTPEDALAAIEGQGQDQSNAVAMPAAENEIILNVIENSWVEIRGADGETIVSRVLKAGDQYFVPDRPDLKMSIGNAGGVEIILNGDIKKILGERGQVRRDISLDAQSLKTIAEND